MLPAASHAFVTIAIIAVIAWRLQSRIRRMIGRQRLSPVRPWLTLVVFPLLILPLALASRSQPLAGAYLACGVVLGIALGVLGLHLTRFDVLSTGSLYYTPSAHLGMALCILLVCRIAYRFAVGGPPGSAVGAPRPGTALTPLTLLLRWSSRSRMSRADLPS
jgi:hypothetical protein